MKYTLIVALVLSSTAAFAADDVLARKALQEVEGAKAQLKALIASGNSSPEVQSALRQISEAKKDLNASLQPPVATAPSGHYCAAACQSSSGSPDLRQTIGMSAPFELQARESAKSAAVSKFGCGFGVVVLSCSTEFSNSRFNAIAACENSGGTADMRQIKGGEGHSPDEAQTNARNAVVSAQGCGFGVVDVIGSSDSAPTYCTAACQSSGGSPDQRQSKGDQGYNKVDAMLKALTETTSTYGCGFGVVITGCSEE